MNSQLTWKGRISMYVLWIEDYNIVLQVRALELDVELALLDSW